MIYCNSLTTKSQCLIILMGSPYLLVTLMKWAEAALFLLEYIFGGLYPHCNRLHKANDQGTGIFNILSLRLLTSDFCPV